MPKRRVPVRALREIADAVSAERSTSFATVEVGRAALVAALRDKLHASPELAAALARVQADNPMSSAVGIGPGASVVHNAGPVFRAAYLIRAAQRTQAADDPSAQATAERRYLRQHQTAQAAREIGAMRLDAARAAYGRTLGWYARDDDRVTPECAAASGKNFDPTHPPAIGLPGLGPHVGCRCVAGPPHAGAAFLSGGVPEVAPLPGTTVREPAHLPGDAAIAASVSSGRAVDLAASSKKPKPGPGGTEVQGDGLTYDPATRSFHPTTSAEGDFNSKHPRVAKGKAGGGKFTNKSGGGSGSGSSKGSGSKGSGSGSKGSGSKGSSGGSSGSSSGGSSGSSSAAQTAASKRLIAATAAAAKAKTAADKKAAAAEVAAAKAALVAAKAKAAADAKAHPPAPSKTVGMAVDSMEKASTPSPIGAPGGPGLWRHKGKQLPPYIQHIAKALIRGGMAESHAIASAVNTVKRWAVGGGQVHPDTQAAAGKALAEWEADKAESHAHSNGQAGIELADGPHRYRRKKGGTRVPVDLAVQVGSVPVRASGDGPRVTGSATGRAAFLVALGKRKKKRRRRPVSLSFWNEAKHPRAPKGTHLGGEWWKAGSLGSSKKKTHDDLRGLLTGRDGLNNKADWDKPRTGDGVMREQKAPAVRAAERAAARAKAGGSSTGSRSRPEGLNDKATWDEPTHKAAPSKPTPTGKAGRPQRPPTSDPHRIGTGGDPSRSVFASDLRAQLDAELPIAGEKIGAARTKNGSVWAKAGATAALTATLMGWIGANGGEESGYSDQGSPDFYGGTSVSSMKGHHDDAPAGPNLLQRSTAAALSWATSERC